MGNPIPVIFNDASDGLIYGSLRVKLPTDVTYLSRIQTDYNGMDRLMQDLVRPTVNKVIYASGPLMSAFESYAEKKNDLIEYITDQLNNGVYKTTVKTIESVDPITGEKKTVKVAALIPDENAPGGYKRSEVSPFSYYGLEIGQVAVSKIDYSDKVKAQIAQQQEANMMVQTSKAKTLAAQQEAIRAEEAGKAAAMEAKWQQEKIKAVEVTKAEQEFEVARLAALKAKEDAKRIEAQGLAEAAAAKAKVAAGLTPLEKATIEKETAIGIAQALADSKVRWVPEIIVSGDGGNGGNAMDAVGLNMMMDIVKKMNSEKK
jgi:regulator of protease activity HflC (stomatin/prohibitin superfamily)